MTTTPVRLTASIVLPIDPRPAVTASDQQFTATRVEFFSEWDPTWGFTSSVNLLGDRLGITRAAAAPTIHSPAETIQLADDLPTPPMGWDALVRGYAVQAGATSREGLS